MKHLFLLLFCFAWSHYSSFAQTQPLTFTKGGKFKIVQFTDVHMKFGNPASNAAIERINEVLTAEQPDLVVFTGDIVYAAPADKGLNEVLKQVSRHKIPFVVTYGNHDDEFGLSREQLHDATKAIPYNITPDYRLNPDFVLPIHSSDGVGKEKALLYCLDSNAYTEMPEAKGYAWLSFDQIGWYLKKSAEFTARNNQTPLPALAFFHIPLPEYSEAAASESAVLFGSRMEKSCPPKLNSGMFTAMKQGGDVMGVFVGHDHDNDYATLWKGIVLAYGRYSGGNTVYNNLSNGARVIVLDEGSRTFSTWTHTANHQIENKLTYPASFTKKK